MGFPARLRERRQGSQLSWSREALLALVPQRCSVYLLLRWHESDHTRLCGRPRMLSTVGLKATAGAGGPGLICPFLAAVLGTLRHLSTTTSVLTDPSQLPEQAAQAVTRIGKTSGES